VYHQQITATKLSSDGYVPKSARIKFELGATTRVKETTAFKTLADAVKNMVATFQSGVANMVAEAADLERKLIESDIKDLFCRAAHDIANITMISAFPDMNRTKEARTLVLHALQSDVTAFTHVGFTSTEVFYEHYKRVTTPPTSDTDDDDSADDALDSMFANPSISTAEQAFVQTYLAVFNKTIVDIFYRSWKIQLDVYSEQNRQLAMDKFAKLSLETKATDAAAALMDAEPTVPAATMDTLIENKVNEKTKKLQTQIEKLTSELKRNNDGKNKRGATEGRASEKKKSPSPSKKRKTTTAPATPNAQRKRSGPAKKKKEGSAADAANASKKGSAKKTSIGKSAKKKPPSNKGKKHARAK
jgi:hypothetical protein